MTAVQIGQFATRAEDFGNPGHSGLSMPPNQRISGVSGGPR